MERRTVLTGDGVRLALHCLGPEEGVPVLLLPGMMSNRTLWLGTRERGLARTLAAAGFSCWVVEPRGHGESQRHGANPFRFDDWIRYDVPAALRLAAARGPAFLVGHSAGGAALLASLAARGDLREGCAGVVLLATPAPGGSVRRRALAVAFLALSLGLGRFPGRALRLGPEDEPAGVFAEWMAWNALGRWRAGGMDYLASLEAIRVPVLAFSGAGDRAWAPPSSCQALVERTGAADRSHRVCGRAQGYGSDLDHAGVATAPEVWREIEDWLRARAGGAREGFPRPPTPSVEGS